MSFTGLVKFLIGFIIAIALLVGAGVAGALYFVTKLTSPPPRPVFANDKNINNKVLKPEVAKTPPKVTNASTTPASSSETPANVSEKPLEPGAYKARIVWSSGLSLRNEPSQKSDKVGSVTYNETVVVLAENDEKKWVKIRKENSEEQGWVKARNIKRLEDGEQTP